MQVCFVGIGESGKTTTITLLHLRAMELHLENTMGYHVRSTDDGGLDLILFTLIS